MTAWEGFHPVIRPAGLQYTHIQHHHRYRSIKTVRVRHRLDQSCRFQAAAQDDAESEADKTQTGRKRTVAQEATKSASKGRGSRKRGKR